MSIRPPPAAGRGEHDPLAVRERLERSDDLGAQRHAPPRALGLRVRLQAAFGERLVHREHAGLEVEGGPVGAEGLLGAHAGPDAEDDERAVRTQLVRERLDRLPGLERIELRARMHRVGNVRCDVAVDPAPAHGCGEDLAKRPVRTLAHRLGHASPPPRDGQRVEFPDCHIAERVGRLDEVVAQPVAARGRALVLLQEHVDQIAQRNVGLVERSEPSLAQLVVEDLLGLCLRPEAAALTAHAAAVAVADRPPARGVLHLARPRLPSMAIHGPAASEPTDSRRVTSHPCCIRPSRSSESASRASSRFSRALAAA